MLFNREEIEHAHTSARRLRARLDALAALAAAPARAGRAERIAGQAITTLEARACIFHRMRDGGKAEVVVVLGAGEDQTGGLERMAARAAAEVCATRRAVRVSNLAAQHPGERWLDQLGVNAYMGVPLFGDDGQVVGVAAVLGKSAQQQFNDEDGYWLSAAAQPLADALAYELMEARCRALEERLRQFEQAGTGKTGASGDASNEVQPASNRSVLVIDDDRTVNDLICELLTLEGFQAEAAFDGLEAMRVFRPAQHYAVITDVAMPLMNGWELIAALRVRAPELPVILITGYGSGNWNESYLRKQGVAAIFSKPLDMNRLVSVLHQISVSN